MADIISNNDIGVIYAYKTNNTATYKNLLNHQEEFKATPAVAGTVIDDQTQTIR